MIVNGPADIPPKWWETPCLEHVEDIPTTRLRPYAKVKREDTVRRIPYRLWLRRKTVYVNTVWDRPGPRVYDYDLILFVMINPSTARESVRDHTDVKCNGFAARLSGAAYGIVNLFSRSTPYQRELFDCGVDAAIGPHNRVFLRNALLQAKAHNWPVVVACGSPTKLSSEGKKAFEVMLGRVANTAARLEVPLLSLAVTDSGYPRHPLMLGYDQVDLKPWRKTP